MICPRCKESISADAIVCPACGLTLSSAAHVPPPADEQTSPPTTPYARTIPVLTPSTPFSTSAPSAPTPPSPDETPTILAMPAGESAAPESEEARWAAVPPLLSTTEPEDVPFAMTSAASERNESPLPDSEPESDALPDYDTPDIERPAIHVPKPPLPDYDTPDIERPAVRPIPANGQFAPVHTPDETASANGSAYNAGLYPQAKPSYPNTYTGPQAAQIDGTASFSTASTATSLPPHGNTPIERFFGVQPAPRNRTANNMIQRLWLRHLPPDWAIAPWISIPIGALTALVAGLLVTAIGLIVWSRAVGYLLETTNAASTNAGLLWAVHSPNLLQLFLLEHGISLSLTLGSAGDTGSFSSLATVPLTGLSLIPLCALLLAGYVAAASDFTHHLRFSVLRGALVGPVYAVLLLLVALFSSSTTQVAQNTVIQLHPSFGHTFLAGLIGGTVLGALGGLLAIRRHLLFTTNLQPDFLAGASWGALIALGSGLLLATVALIAGMAAHTVGTVPAATVGASGNGLLSAIGSAVVTLSLLIVGVPVGALWLFALGTGANIDNWFTSSGISAGSGSSTFGLLVAQHHPSSIAWWLLLLIPLASYIIGGRAAAHIARADSLRDGAVAGWFMALALSMLMLVLTLLSRILLSSEAHLFDRTVTTSLGIAPSPGAVFLLVLFVGGVVGAIGGLSAIAAPQLDVALAPMTTPLLPKLARVLSLALRPWDMFDAARGQRSPRTPLLVLLYAALLLAVLLGALFLVVVVLGWIASHFAPISAVRGVDGFFAGLAVGVPLLLLASAAILMILRALPPLLTRHQAKAPVIPRYPSA